MTKYTDFFQVGGTLDEDAPSYIERPADHELLEAIEKQEYCLVLAPRQTGKSSLMVRTCKLLSKNGTKAGIIDMQSLGNAQDPDRWFNDVIHQLQRSLSLKIDCTEWLKTYEHLGPTQRFRTFIEDVILTETGGQLVVFIDEIDSILKLPFSDDFFTTLRSLYNARATDAKLKNLIFVLLGVVTATELIQDRTRTPYNIGTAISLEDFDQDEATVHRFKEVLGEQSQSLIERIFYWSHGQPFLVQKLAQAIHSLPQEKRTVEAVDESVNRLFLRQKIEQDTHLKYIQDYILADVVNVRKSLRVYRRILHGKPVPFNDKEITHNRLKLSGLVRISEGKLVLRNTLYKKIFTYDWTHHYAIERRHVCSKCEYKNEENAEFCTDCGEKLIRRCPECGREQELHHKHCPNCGADLDNYFDALDAVESIRHFAEEYKWNEIIDQFMTLPNTLKLHTDKGEQIKQELQQQLNQAKAYQKKWQDLHKKIWEEYEKGNYEKSSTMISECLELNPHDKKILELKEKLPDLIRSKEKEDYEIISTRAPDLIGERKYDELRSLISTYLQSYPDSNHASQFKDYLKHFLPILENFGKFRMEFQELDHENSISTYIKIEKQVKKIPNLCHVIMGTSFTPGSILSEVNQAISVLGKIKNKISQKPTETSSNPVVLNSSGKSEDAKIPSFKLIEIWDNLLFGLVIAIVIGALVYWLLALF